MNWTDTALMLSVAKKSSTVLNLNLLTKNHGRCLCRLKFKPNEVSMLLPGCEMEINSQMTGMEGIYQIQIQNVSHGIIAESMDDLSILVVRYINELLSDVLPVSEPFQELYTASVALVRALEMNDPRWPVRFVHWEMAVLSALGHTYRFRRCKSDVYRGETIYMARQNGKVYTRSEAGAFLDRMVPVPYMVMGMESGTIADLHQSLDLISMLFADLVYSDADGDGEPDVRTSILAHIDAIENLPPPPKTKKQNNQMSEEDYQRRLRAMRSLTVNARPNNE